MDYIEKTGKTVADAVAAALAELQITEEEADITVLEQGKEGMFLGIYEVRLTRNKEERKQVRQLRYAVFCEEEGASVTEEQKNVAESAPVETHKVVVSEEVVDKAKKFLQEVFSAMKIEAAMEKFINPQDGSVTIRLHGDDMGILIGKHGQTLDSLQYLTNLVANKEEKEWTRISLYNRWRI